MSVTPYERAFIQHLVLPDSLALIVREEFAPEVIPTEDLRPIYIFALNYWHAEATEGFAPSPEAMREHFGVTLAEHEIDLDIEPQDILDYALEGLRGAFIDRTWQKWVKTFAGGMATADVLAKPELLSDAINELMQVQQMVAPSHEHAEIRVGVDRALVLYHEREELRRNHRVDGAVLGLPPVDTHMAGIRPGELLVFAGPPKSGKSYMTAVGALACWAIGMTPTIMTLENSTEMTIDRIACYAAGVPSRSWQRGECTTAEIERVRAWRAEITRADHPMHIIQPEIGKRTMSHMVRRARTIGDMLFIDQLTFVEPRPQDERLPKYQQVGNSLHDLKALLTSGDRMPCFLAHQINREGVKAAEKNGFLEMYHMAEAAEVERTADWVAGIYRTRTMQSGGTAYFQLLAARREDLLDWNMRWMPWLGTGDMNPDNDPMIHQPDNRVLITGQIDLRAAND